MVKRTGLEKAAILLYRMPVETVQQVLEELGPVRRERLQPELEKLRQQEKAPDDLNEIIRAFQDMLRQGDLDSLAAPPIATPRQLAAYRPPSDLELPMPQEPPSPEIPGEAMNALEALSSDVLLAVLHGEQAHTVAIVLNSLDSEKAGQILRQLTPDLRRDVSIRLSRMTSSPPELLARIAAALVRKSRSLAGKPSETSMDARYEKMANMLRCLEKAERLEVLTALEESEPETANRIKGLLYQFEDLLRIHDRSMQKLLAEIDAKTLSVALKGANEAINSKVMNNLSKRARETLGEEMEYLGMVPIAQVRQAQKTLVDAIQRLDQAGELMMEE